MSGWSLRLSTILLLSAVTITTPALAHAQSIRPRSGEDESSNAPKTLTVGSDQPVPVMDNFTVAELVTTGVLTVTAAGIGFFGEHIVGFPDPSFGPPAPGSTDWEVSVHINPHPNLNDHFLWNIPNKLADPVLVSVAGAYYGFGAIGTWLTDADWIWDTRHEFLAFAGAVAWTQAFVQLSKFTFGRDRPRVVRACNPPADPCGKYGIRPSRNVESNRQDGLSFPGGHVGATAAALSFIYLDWSDHLVYHTLAEASGATRFWVGRVLPLIPTYGFIGLSFYERLYSQEHWLSDQVVGAVVGLAAGNAFYLLHFDDTGDPLRDNRDDDADDGGIADSRVMPVLLGDGEVGVGWGFSW